MLVELVSVDDYWLLMCGCLGVVRCGTRGADTDQVGVGNW